MFLPLALNCPHRVTFSPRTLVVAVGISLSAITATVAEEPDNKAPKPSKRIQYHENTIGMKLALISAGKFRMGSNSLGSIEKPVHDVTISNPFYMGTTEVTQGQWHAVMGTKPWEEGRYRTKEGDNYPAVYVDRIIAAEFCKRLSKKEGKTYRLPTEAEWEYACRAGTTTRFSFGDSATSLNDYAWTEHNKGEGYAKEVGMRKPNAWGLYDMHGNVDEWCSDVYGEYPDQHVIDPRGPTDEELDPAEPVYWMWRGGNWESRFYHCASASRHADIPIDYVIERNSLGFRVVLEHNQPKGSLVQSKEPTGPAR